MQSCRFLPGYEKYQGLFGLAMDILGQHTYVPAPKYKPWSIKLVVMFS